MIDLQALDRVLRESAEDAHLDNEERLELRDIGQQATADQVRYLRNRAFDIARDSVRADPSTALELLRWLEQVVKTLEVAAVGASAATTAFFSPGDACLRQLQSLWQGAKRTADACVFTISDDRITRAILDAQRRGVTVRIVSDDDKRLDTGSDLDELSAAGIDVRTDATPYHMHHKFAVFDGATVANGSFNWTRSASANNFENLVVSKDPYLARVFAGHFETLWNRFA
ncbi:phospholipase D-like domain-containing protein [Lysobacter sp. HA35]